MADVKAKLFIWTEARTRSTAIMRCLSNRQDVQAFFEPYVYVAVSGKPEDRLNNYFLENGLVEEISSLSKKFIYDAIEESHKDNHVVVKDFAFTINKDYSLIPKDACNVILIRHPGATGPSFQKMVNEKMRIAAEKLGEDQASGKLMNGNEAMLDLYRYLKKNGRQVVVIDSNDLTMKPEEVIKYICRLSGLPYDSSMLSWKTLSSNDYPQNWWMSKSLHQLLENCTALLDLSKSTGFHGKSDPFEFDISSLSPFVLFWNMI